MGWTALVAGLCASVFTHIGAETPMVAIGTVVGNECAWQFGVPDGIGADRIYMIGGAEHAFRSRLSATYATVTVDGVDFKVPRENTL
jgi:hypothetical protein